MSEILNSMENTTIAAIKYYEEKLQNLHDIMEANDRRYTEVNIEKEKALKIKETADLAALTLAREIQAYKDEKANELREQINHERLLYASKEDLNNAVLKIEAIITPVVAYVNSAGGRSGGFNQGWLYLIGGLSAIGTIISIVVLITRL